MPVGGGGGNYGSMMGTLGVMGGGLGRRRRSVREEEEEGGSMVEGEAEAGTVSRLGGVWREGRVRNLDSDLDLRIKTDVGEDAMNRVEKALEYCAYVCERKSAASKVSGCQYRYSIALVWL